MPKVYNKRNKNVPIPAGATLVDRKTKWGNPFVIGRDGTREDVVRKYRKAILVKPDYISEVRRTLKGKDLVCWCAPLACHGDVLLEIANGRE